MCILNGIDIDMYISVVIDGIEFLIHEIDFNLFDLCICQNKSILSYDHFSAANFISSI